MSKDISTETNILTNKYFLCSKSAESNKPTDLHRHNYHDINQNTFCRGEMNLLQKDTNIVPEQIFSAKSSAETKQLTDFHR